MFRKMKKELHNLYYVTEQEHFLSETTLANGHRIRWNSGEIVLPNDGIFYISSGTVRIASILENGQRKTLMLAGRGHFLHEVAFFHKKAGDTEISALGSVLCHFFSANVISRLLSDDTDFRNAILFSMAAKLSTQTIDLLLTDYSGALRLFYLLRAMANHSSMFFTIPLDIPITQSELADCLGMHRVSVNRLLKDLERHRLIRCSRGKITLLSMDFWKKTSGIR